MARVIVVGFHVSDALEISNRYAPEHLILNCRSPQPRAVLPDVTAAGFGFSGPGGRLSRSVITVQRHQSRVANQWLRSRLPEVWL